MKKIPVEHNAKALIVEDEIDICYLLSEILKEKNLQTTCVTSINEAEKKLSKENPCILFLDNHLPDGYGLDFITEIKKDHPETKVIMITADVTIADKEKALGKGADYFIAKPFTKAAVLNTIDMIIKSKPC